MRLAFRSAKSSGLIEICNAQGIWSIACRDTFDKLDESVLCRQLGFTTPTNSFQELIPSHLNKSRQKFNENLNCLSGENSFIECQLNQARERREKLSVLCGYQAGVQCGGIYLYLANSHNHFIYVL